MLSIGAGLEMELSGYENIFLLGTLMGLAKKEIKEMYGNIISFSELNESDLKMEVKRYSSGMMSRLAFSISLARNPDILIVDEALVVGDLGFQKKCLDKINAIRNEGCTIIYVSHNPSELLSICNKGIYLSDGRIIQSGTMKDVAHNYTASFAQN